MPLRPRQPRATTMIFDPVYMLAMFGTAVFALSGAMAAARQNLDIFGFIIVGLAPAIGGGTLRDLLLDAERLFWIDDLNYILVASAVSIIAFFQVHRLDGKRYTLLTWADAIGMALFSIMGTQAAMNYDIHPLIVIIMGMVTATFGGMLRDIICNEVPFLLQKEIYALAALAGSLVYMGLVHLGVAQNIAMTLSIIAIIAIRGPALIWGWSLPPYRPRHK